MREYEYMYDDDDLGSICLIYNGVITIVEYENMLIMLENSSNMHENDNFVIECVIWSFRINMRTKGLLNC